MTGGTGLEYITAKGSIIPVEAMKAVDHLLEMHKKMPQWEFIGLCVTVWARKHPDLWSSYTSRSQNAKYRGDLKKETGANADNSLRTLADIPADLMDLLTFFYPDEAGTKRFLVSFIKEFPMFKTAERI